MKPEEFVTMFREWLNEALKTPMRYPSELNDIWSDRELTIHLIACLSMFVEDNNWEPIARYDANTEELVIDKAGKFDKAGVDLDAINAEGKRFNQWWTHDGNTDLIDAVMWAMFTLGWDKACQANADVDRDDYLQSWGTRKDA